MQMIKNVKNDVSKYLPIEGIAGPFNGYSIPKLNLNL